MSRISEVISFNKSIRITISLLRVILHTILLITALRVHRIIIPFNEVHFLGVAILLGIFHRLLSHLPSKRFWYPSPAHSLFFRAPCSTDVMLSKWVLKRVHRSLLCIPSHLYDLPMLLMLRGQYKHLLHLIALIYLLQIYERRCLLWLHEGLLDLELLLLEVILEIEGLRGDQVY